MDQQSVETLLRRLVERVEESERRYSEALNELHARLDISFVNVKRLSQPALEQVARIIGRACFNQRESHPGEREAQAIALDNQSPQDTRLGVDFQRRLFQPETCPQGAGPGLHDPCQLRRILGRIFGEGAIIKNIIEKSIDVQAVNVC